MGFGLEFGSMYKILPQPSDGNKPLTRSMYTYNNNILKKLNKKSLWIWNAFIRSEWTQETNFCDIVFYMEAKFCTLDKGLQNY
jgi:hypothetical protein